VRFTIDLKPALKDYDITEILEELSGGKRTILVDGAIHLEKLSAAEGRRLGYRFESPENIQLMHDRFMDLSDMGIDYWNPSVMNYTGTGIMSFHPGFPMEYSIPTVYYQEGDPHLLGDIIDMASDWGTKHIVRKNLLRHWSSDVSIWTVSELEEALHGSEMGHIFQPFVMGPYSDRRKREARIGVVRGEAVFGLLTTGAKVIDPKDPKIDQITGNRAQGAQIAPYDIEPDMRAAAERIAQYMMGKEDEFREAYGASSLLPLDFMGVDLIRDRHGNPRLMEVHLRPNFYEPPLVTPLAESIADGFSGYEKAIVFTHRNVLHPRIYEVLEARGADADLYQVV
jgi:hypothetical protein